MSHVLRLFRTVRYVKPHQLIARLHLKLRRKWRVRYADRYRKVVQDDPLPDLKLAPSTPAPVFGPRCDLASVQEDGSYTLTFLNESRDFNHPFDWHPADLEYGTRLWLLNLHYMEFLEALPDAAFVDVIQDWIANVPPYRPGYWMDDWNSYALSIRCVVWMQQYAKRREQLPSAFCDTLLASLYRQMRFLEENLEHDIGGNHLVKNIKALLWAGRFFSTAEATSWYSLGEQLLDKELGEQVLADGMHYERSPAYHTQVFADFLECYVLMDRSAVKDKLEKKLHTMAQVLADLTHPDSYISLFNDGGLHMTYRPESCLKVWRDLSGAYVQPRANFAFENAGYFGARYEDQYVLVDCGKVAPDFLTAHGHGDILSFEWTIGGQRMIVDAGVYEYNVGPRRAYSRSTSAHNTVTVDGKDQCEFWSSFRMAHRARVQLKEYSPEQDRFTLTGLHDGYRNMKGAPKHERTFEVKKDNIHIKDNVYGGAGQLVESRLLFHPDCVITREEDSLVIKREGSCIRLKTQAKVEVTEGRWFPDFGVEYPCQQAVIRYGIAPCEGEFQLERMYIP